MAVSHVSQIRPKRGKHHPRETPHQLEKQQAMAHSVESLRKVRIYSINLVSISILSMTKLENSTKMVTVERPFMKLCCMIEICGQMIGVISSQLISSKSFGITDKMNFPCWQEISRFSLEHLNDKAFFPNSSKNTSR
jgi:hypothetical protein